MAWESRTKNKQYYYKHRRINGKRVREYHGSGPAAELLARADQLAAQARAAERAQLQANEDEFKRVIHILDQQDRLLQLLIDAHLIVAGYYKHKGEWRKRRNKIP